MPSYVLDVNGMIIDIARRRGQVEATIFDPSTSTRRPIGQAQDPDPYRALGLALDQALQTRSGKPTAIHLFLREELS